MVNLIISGNLTGFSRFYSTPEADKLASVARFDFDYRNEVTFLNYDEKVYVIGFAKDVIAVSLVTRVLDSFRRPGIVAVSAIIPRHSRIVSCFNSTEKDALYNLLNRVNDRFYEKNSTGNQLNQNISVLLKDYYSDILSEYSDVPDPDQRNINAEIDSASVMKRSAYVRSEESDVPRYLSSLCRKSYQGYHLVFIGQNVSSTIKESPEEVVLYTVNVTNTGRTLSGVRLTDLIYNCLPDQGEIDFDKSFTYKQVLAGDAGSRVTAYARGETIEITYNFAQEEKTVNFVFSDGESDIQITLVAPVIDIDGGNHLSLPDNRYVFKGKEIYAYKTIRANGSRYKVRSDSSRIDLTRIPDGGTYIVYVAAVENRRQATSPVVPSGYEFSQENNMPMERRREADSLSGACLYGPPITVWDSSDSSDKTAASDNFFKSLLNSKMAKLILLAVAVIGGLLMVIFLIDRWDSIVGKKDKDNLREFTVIVNIEDAKKAHITKDNMRDCLAVSVKDTQFEKGDYSFTIRDSIKKNCAKYYNAVIKATADTSIILCDTTLVVNYSDNLTIKDTIRIAVSNADLLSFNELYNSLTGKTKLESEDVKAQQNKIEKLEYAELKTVLTNILGSIPISPNPEKAQEGKTKIVSRNPDKGPADETTIPDMIIYKIHDAMDPDRNNDDGIILKDVEDLLKALEKDDPDAAFAHRTNINYFNEWYKKIFVKKEKKNQSTIYHEIFDSEGNPKNKLTWTDILNLTAKYTKPDYI